MIRFRLSSTLSLVFLLLAPWLTASAQWDHFKGGTAPGGGPLTKAGLAPDVVVRAQASAYAEALVKLKLEEIELSFAEQTDEKAVDSNMAKQRMVIREMAELTVAHLRRERAEMTKSFKPGHPKMVEIDAEIDRRLRLAGVEMP